MVKSLPRWSRAIGAILDAKRAMSLVPSRSFYQEQEPHVEQAEIGLIGLGVMGGNLALNIAE